MKRIVLFLLCILLCGAWMVPACGAEEDVFDETLVFDNGKILSPEDRGQVKQRLETVSQEFDVYVYLLTENSIEDADTLAYAERFYFTHGLGCGENRDGILLFLCMDRREWAIYGVGLGENAVADGYAAQIGEKIRPFLVERDCVGAVTVFGAECMVRLDTVVDRHLNATGATVTAVIFIGVGATLIVTGFLRKKRKNEQVA